MTVMTGGETIHHAVLVHPETSEEIATLNKVLAVVAKVPGMAPMKDGQVSGVLESHDAPAVVARRLPKAAHLMSA